MAQRRGHGALGRENDLADEHVVEDAAERVQVGAPIDLTPARLLGRHELRRAGDTLGGVSGELGHPREPEIHEHDAPGRRLEQHVVRLEIAVHHAALVRRAQPLGDLARDGQRFVNVEAADARNPLRQRLTVDVLHLHDPAVLDLLQVVGAAHILVADLLRQEHLVAQPLERRLALGELLVEELERDLLAQHLVDRAVDRAHAADAEEGFHLVTLAEKHARPGVVRR